MRILLLAALVVVGCSHRADVPVPTRPPGFFQLAEGVLIPPHGGGPVTIDVPDPNACPAELDGLSVERTARAVRLHPSESTLRGLERGGLSRWAVELERTGCLASGDAPRLARRIAHSVPSPLGEERRLLEVSEGRDGYLDLRVGYRLRTVRPVFRDGAEATSALRQVGETEAVPGGGLTVTVRATEALVGYERAWYEFVPGQASGAVLRPLETVLVIEGEESSQPSPLDRWLAFDDDARYFRLLFLSRLTETAENDILLVGAPTPVAVEDHTEALRQDPERCADLFGCKRAPVETAVLPFITVDVDGDPVPLAPGARIRSALATESKPSDELDGLAVWKPSGGRLVPVRFDDDSILRLPLLGGERIRTKSYAPTQEGASGGHGAAVR